MKKETREKLVEDLLNNRRTYSYSDSKRIIDETEKELNKILESNQKGIEELLSMQKSPEVDLSNLKKELETDFNTKIEVPEKTVVGKSSKEIFDLINRELKEKVIGQDEAIDKLTIAFRRPYVVG